jgi:hypothetical protein
MHKGKGKKKYLGQTGKEIAPKVGGSMVYFKWLSQHGFSLTTQSRGEPRRPNRAGHFSQCVGVIRKVITNVFLTPELH